jgi:ribonuclease T1
VASTGKASRALIGLAVVAAASGLGWWISSDDGDDTSISASTSTASTSTTATATTSTAATVAARTGTDPESGVQWIALEALPPEALDTLDLINQGGPFPYDRDGVTFQNREGILPDRPNGYYREYTVETPGSDDRGARRIVTGDGGDEYFYTEDHYDSFERIDW